MNCCRWILRKSEDNNRPLVTECNSNAVLLHQGCRIGHETKKVNLLIGVTFSKI